MLDSRLFQGVPPRGTMGPVTCLVVETTPSYQGSKTYGQYIPGNPYVCIQESLWVSHKPGCLHEEAKLIRA